MGRITCENCDGQGYTDMGRSACGVCLGGGVTTPELLAALSQRERFFAALARIAEGRETDFDEGEGHDVLVPMDGEDMSAIAYAALNEGAHA